MKFCRLSLFVLIIVSLFTAAACSEDVKNGEAPVITLSGGRIFRVGLGESVTLSPSFEFLTESAVIQWILDGNRVGTGPEYTFSASVPGVYYLSLVVSTEWGSDAIELRFDVYDDTLAPPDTVPLPPADFAGVQFGQREFHVSQGRTIRLMPFDTDRSQAYRYGWRIDGVSVQESEEPAYCFEAVRQGRFQVEFSMSLDGTTLFEDTLQVLVCPPEGTYRRPASAGSSPRLTRVFSFLPAPGQYVNEAYTVTTMEEACDYAFSLLHEQKLLSLGAFGGSIVVGFDHSIDNDGDYNLAVKSLINSNDSEPGIVWVMQDEDGNGLPDDTWYELKGSEYGLDCTVSDYAVTYYRPAGPGRPVSWTDNLGESGTIDYLAGFHKQETYYPLWVEADSYTLRGTRLEARNRDSGNGTSWILPDYGWGYADNFSETDMLPDRATGISAGSNHFKISDAVTFDGKPANLQYIDFVRIQTGLNGKSGWLGEISTEVADIIDFNLVK